MRLEQEVAIAVNALAERRRTEEAQERLIDLTREQLRASNALLAELAERLREANVLLLHRDEEISALNSRLEQARLAAPAWPSASGTPLDPGKPADSAVTRLERVTRRFAHAARESIPRAWNAVRRRRGRANERRPPR